MAVRYKPNRGGLREVLQGPGAQQLVQRYGSQVLSRLPDGYVASYRPGKARFRGILYANTMKAKRREARENNLVRALG